MIVRVNRCLILFVFVVTVCGCRQIWDRGAGLEASVSKILARVSDENIPLDCTMIQTTRAGTCEGRIYPDIIERLVEQLNLAEVRAGQPRDYEFEVWANAGEDACSQKHPGSGIKIFKSKRRAPQLRLEDGSSFEYFLLFYNLETNAACIQVSFAYG